MAVTTDILGNPTTGMTTDILGNPAPVSQNVGQFDLAQSTRPPGFGDIVKFQGTYLDAASGNLLDSTGKVVMTAQQIQAQGIPASVPRMANGQMTDSAGRPLGSFSDWQANLAKNANNNNIFTTTGKAIGGAASASTDPKNLIALGTNGVVDPRKQSEIARATSGAADVAATGITNAIGGLDLGGIGGGDRTIDPKAQSEVDRANNLADVLDVDRQKAGVQADTDRGLGVQTREQQQQAIAGLQAAANGTVPSAAELALTRQSGIDAARQYGLAAALQGSNPAAALRQASMGSARVAGDTAANAVQLRAKEQADARTALANTLAGVRTSDQGAVNTDVTQQNSAQTGETTSQGQGVTAEGNILQRQSAKDQADATKTGAEIGALGALTGGLLTKSDRRAKKDIAKVGLADALGKGVHGVEFEYREPESDREEGPQFGALAQDLEDVIPGVVKKRGDGMRMVDTGHMTMANTAILAELARRLRALEGKGRR